MPPKSKKRAASAERKPVSSDAVDDLNCGICCDIFVNAHQTPCCGNLSCLDCIQQVAVETSKCPYCRKALDSTALLRDARMERMAAATVVDCGHPNCKFSKKRDETVEHRKSCAKRPQADIIDELRKKVEALTASRNQLFWNFKSLHRDDGAPLRYYAEEAMGFRVHVFTAPAEGEYWPDQFNVDAQNELSDYRHPIPQTRMSLVVKPSGRVVITICHVEDADAPTVCWLSAHAEDYTGFGSVKVVIPALSEETVTVDSWVRLEALSATYQSVSGPSHLSTEIHDLGDDDEGSDGEGEDQ